MAPEPSPSGRGTRVRAPGAVTHRECRQVIARGIGRSDGGAPGRRRPPDVSRGTSTSGSGFVRVQCRPRAHRAGENRAASKIHSNHALSAAIRRHRHRGRPCRHRGGARVGPDGAQHAAADAQHRDSRADVVQSLHRRHRQGPPGQGSGRAGRRDGDRHRRGGHPVQGAQFEQGSGGSRDACPGRSRSLQGGDSAPPRDPAQPDTVPAGRRRPADSRRPGGRRRHANRGRVRGGCGGADRRHLPVRVGACRPAELRGGPRGRPPGQAPRGAAARAGAADRAAQDRDAAASRRADNRLQRLGGAAGRRSRPRVFVHGSPVDASAPGALLDHPYQQPNTRDHPRWARPLAALHRGHSGRRPPLLSVDRGQGRALPGPASAPDLSRAGRLGHDRDLPQRHLHLPAVRRPARARAVDEGL